MLDTKRPNLPAHYALRMPTEANIPAILALLDAFELAETGKVAGFNAEDIRSGWQALTIETDAWIVEATDGCLEGVRGHLAGYGEITDWDHGQLVADCYVHPRHTGRGIGTALVRLTEQRARELVERAPEGERVSLVNNVVASSRPACDLLERAGYTAIRYFSEMRGTLGTTPEPPTWPDGVVVRTFVPGQDERAVFDAVDESFADHWGHTPMVFDDWVKRTRREDFDPTLWFLAEDGASLAGVALCSNRGADGHVNTLGVRRPWRRRGLGMALLLHSFGEFYRRTRPTIGLGVDADSLTGATRLYERAGMHVASQAARYEKELRPGMDRRTQTLAE